MIRRRRRFPLFLFIRAVVSAFWPKRYCSRGRHFWRRIEIPQLKLHTPIDECPKRPFLFCEACGKMQPVSEDFSAIKAVFDKINSVPPPKPREPADVVAEAAILGPRELR